MKAWCWLAAGWMLGASVALGVEAGEVRLAERWSVVGVISSGDGRTRGTGIVVLRHNQSARTYTLTLGDEMPREYGFVLSEIKKRGVIVSDGRHRHLLSFAESPPSKDDSDSQRTAQFIDNYYRGLNEIPMEILSPDAGDVSASEGSVLALPTFGRLPNDAMRSRFELYRSERLHGLRTGDGADDMSPDDGGEGFIVNYDNFEDAERDDGDDTDAGAIAASRQAGSSGDGGYGAENAEPPRRMPYDYDRIPYGYERGGDESSSPD